MRVSSRENISQIALKKHEPIYNSFKGEVCSQLFSKNYTRFVCFKNESDLGLKKLVFYS